MVIGFMPPLIAVKRKSDGQMGWLEFHPQRHASTSTSFLTDLLLSTWKWRDEAHDKSVTLLNSKALSDPFPNPPEDRSFILKARPGGVY